MSENSAIPSQAILDAISDGVLIIDKNGIVRVVNRAAQTLFDPGTPFGFPVAVGETIEMEIARKTGEAITAQLHMVEMTSESEVVYLAQLRDITDLKERERQFRFYDSLQENVSDAVVTTDLQLRI